MVRLMQLALGLNDQTAEAFLSPTKDAAPATNGKKQNGTASKKVEDDFDDIVVD